MMKRIWMFFLIFLLAFANTDEWIVMEEPASVHTQDENAVKKRFLERVVEKESVVVMVRGKVHTSTPAVRKNRVKIYFYFLLICFFYLQAKRSRKGDVSAELGNFLEYHIRRMRQLHQMDGKKRIFSPTFMNA